MAMEKKGAPNSPVLGKVATPWPSAVLLYKAEAGVFVPQPRLSDEACPCGSKKTRFPDGSLKCEACGPDPK